MGAVVVVGVVVVGAETTGVETMGAETTGLDDWVGEEGATLDDCAEMPPDPEFDGAETMLERMPVERGRVALTEPEAETGEEAPFVVYTLSAFTLQ